MLCEWANSSPLADLVGDAQHLLQVELVLRCLLDDTLHVAAAHQLRDYVGLALLLAEVMDGNDVGVGAETPHRLSLTLDSLAGGVVEALGLDQGEGDIAVELGVVGQVDALLATLAQEALDLVAAGGGRWVG